MPDPNAGTVHVMEEQMRDAKQGVFEPKSGEPRRARKAAEKAEPVAAATAEPADTGIISTVKRAVTRKGK